MIEIWKDIKGFEGFYQASNTGKIKSLDREVLFKDGRSREFKGKELAQYKDKYGYLRVLLSKGTRKNMYSHRLVALAFISNIDRKPQVNHKDCDILNNNELNLEWCTAKENTQHAYKNGLTIKSKPGTCKLLESEVICIIERLKLGDTVSSLSKTFNISNRAIRSIKNGETWKHLVRGTNSREIAEESREKLERSGDSKKALEEGDDER